MRFVRRSLRVPVAVVAAVAVPSLAAAGLRAIPRHAAVQLVEPNDNRVSAGSRHGDTLVVRLRVQVARWYPDTIGGAFVDVAAFGEGGGPPRIPAPMIRAAQGTTMDVTVTNDLADSTLWVHGLSPHPASSGDSVAIAPGDSSRFVFPAGRPGTYRYWAYAGTVDFDKRERETAGGAFIVDSAGAPMNDRVFVVNIWGDPGSPTYRNALAINGRSWPFTERIGASVGDTVRWRWVNASIRPHPMHLHGFYYRVESRGTGLSDTTYAATQRRTVVTEVMRPGATMAMSWVPDRDGNWLFHCHIGFHVVPDDARLDPPRGTGLGSSHDARLHMAGLILGVEVSAPPGWVVARRDGPQQLRLLVQEGRRRGRSPRSLGFVLQRGVRPPAPDSVEVPGTVLVLEEGRPTDVTVVNRLREPSAVHWHGIELESWSDGVAGWSGTGARVAPMIAPSDSFIARLTLARPGTFMYHTHLNDIEQLSSGLYGAIVVLPRGSRFDPATDHVFVGGWDGMDDPPHLAINGDSVPGSLRLAAGVVHRFRFVNIGAAGSFAPVLRQGGAALAWRHVAFDGATLPASQVRDVRTPFPIDVGQTADFEWRPPAPGRYTISISSAGRPDYRQVPLVVR